MKSTLHSFGIGCLLVLALPTGLRAQCLEFTSPGAAGAAVHAFATFDDGSGPALYAAGDFASIGGVPAKGIAKWNGTTWSALPAQLSSPHRVRALCVYDDGSGPALVVGGRFNQAGGHVVNNVAKWNGSSWSAIGAGFVNADPLFGSIRCVESLAVYDDGLGGGAKLFAGGYFTSSGGAFTRLLARFDGGAWTSLGGPTYWCEEYEDAALTLQVFDDGSGPALYAGGIFAFSAVEGLVARWDGVQLTPVGSLLGGLCVGAVFAFEAHPTSVASGGRLYAGGSMPTLSSGVAAWDGSTWQPLGATASTTVALEVFDDGTGAGSSLYADIVLTSDNTRHLAQWDGASWVDEGVVGGSPPPTPGGIWSLYAFDDSGDGADLWIGGELTSIDGVAVTRLAKLSGCGGLGEAYCFGDGSLPTACPCAPPDVVPNPSGAPDAGCANSFNLAGATLRAFGATTPDTAHFIARIGANYGGFAFLVKGNAAVMTGMASHDGILCTSGALLRVGAHNASTNGAPLGSWTYPNNAQTLSVSAATAQNYGEDAHYQLFYRNAELGFCNPATANFTNSVRIGWH